MLQPASRFMVNAPEVAGKVIDGEAIIMNLGSAIYYSTDGAGALVWELAAAGHSLSEIAEAVAQSYGITVANTTTDVVRILEELLRESLLRPADAAAAPLAAPHVAVRTPGSYGTPALQRYDDMAELLALDPPMPTPSATPFPPSHTEQ